MVPDHPAFPAQWFYGLLRALPGEPGFVVTIAAQCDALSRVDASVGASGPHGFAVRKVSALVSSAPRVHRIPPRVRDDREPPLQRDETVMHMQVIWVKREQEYFCKRGWTGKPLICPSGAKLSKYGPKCGARPHPWFS